MGIGNVVFGEWQLEMLAGEPERAAAAAREGLDILDAIGAKNEGSTAAALLAVAWPGWAATRRPSGTPTSPRRGPRPTMSPRRWGS